MKAAADLPAPARWESAAQWSIIALHAVLLALVLPEHEPWADEAQSWLLARDAPFLDLLTQRLRYEGTPGLWHLLLALPAKAGLPYESMQVLGALAALTGVVLLVRWSPFPLWLRALLPFTYFLGYQYALIARSYCLLAPLLFAVALAARHRERRYAPFALCLALLSHVSLHATLFAGAIWLVELGGLWRSSTDGNSRRSRALGLGLLAANFGLIVLQLWLPADLAMRPAHGSLALAARLAGMITEQAFALHLGLSLVLLVPFLFLLRAGRVLLLFLLGTGFVYGLMCFRYLAIWHTGVVMVFALFCAWLALDRLRDAKFAQPARLAGLAALGAIALVQIPGTFTSAWRDFQQPYSGSREAAAYLRERKLEGRVLHGFDFHSGAVLPYFEQNLFANRRALHPGSYWAWNEASFRSLEEAAVLAGRPEFIFVRADSAQRAEFDPRRHGYGLERTFSGEIVWRGQALESDVFLLYRRSDLSQ